MKLDFLINCLCARPYAEPVDAVKLLYQNEFGCGHLLPDEATCAARIREEISATVADQAEPAYEPIGNGLCRINLRNPMVRALSPVRIARMMRTTDTHIHGSQTAFEASLQALFVAAQQLEAQSADSAKRLPFTASEFYAYLQTDALTHLPPSHSARYRAAYQPAYRVALRRYGEALPLIFALEQRLSAEGNATLALDGNCASGKTTLTELLTPLFDCNTFHMDDFFLPLSMRTPARMAEAGGNVHYERFRDQVLRGLLTGQPFAYDAFNCHSGSSHTVPVTPRPVSIIEGSYSLHPYGDAEYLALHAARAILRIQPQEQLRRILLRNGEALLKRFQNEWIPLENRYLEAYHTIRDDELILNSERHLEDEPDKGGCDL